MTDEVSVEASGETTGEAKWAATRELERLVPGLDRAHVRFQVVTEGERGLLGVGQVPARVIATAPSRPGRAGSGAAPEPDDEGPVASARRLVDRVINALGVGAAVTETETETEIRLQVVATDPGPLIGRHGQMIDSIQHIANALAFRREGPTRKHVVLEIAGYRERRTAMLEAQARRAAERAVAEGTAQELDPMSSVDRRTVHECLVDDPSVETSSSGIEPNRRVVVSPRPSPH